MVTDEHGSGGAKANDALYLDTGSAEVDYETDFLARRSQVVKALSAMNAIERRERLQFDDYFVIHDQVGDIISDHFSLIPNFHCPLLLDNVTSPAQFTRKRILVHLLDKPRSERIGNRDGKANDLF